MYPITLNLFEALRRLRHPDRPRHLWIDAVCINQHNKDERSRQVAQMLSIYRKARRVVVWLGGEGEHTDLCCRLSRQLKRLQSPKSLREFTDDACHSHRDMVHRGAKDLLDRPWYSRVWIRQEVWAAQGIVELCGSQPLLWDELWTIAGIADDATHANSYETLPGTTSTYRGIFRGLGPAAPTMLAVVDNVAISEAIKDREGYRIARVNAQVLHVISNASHAERSDPHDRVYGIIGMTVISSVSNRLEYAYRVEGKEPPSLCKFKIDYSRSVTEVFVDLARWILPAHGHLSLLILHARYGGSVEQGRDLPSWCPDWNHPLGTSNLDNSFAPDYRTEKMDELPFRIKDEKLQVLCHEYGTISKSPFTKHKSRMVSVTRFPTTSWKTRLSRQTTDCLFHGDLAVGDVVMRVKSSPAPLAFDRLGGLKLRYKGWVQAKNPFDYLRMVDHVDRSYDTVADRDYRPFEIV